MRADDLGAFADCFNRNHSPRTEEALRWQYLENPAGVMYVDLAFDHGAIAAIYATLPSRMRLNGTVTLGLQSLDTLTDAAHRGKGLFGKLAQLTFRRAALDGVSLVYGFPNKNSAPGFFSKLGWTSLDPVPFLIRPLRTAYVARRLKLDKYLPWIPDVPLARATLPSVRGDWRIERVERFDERASALWAELAGSNSVAVERDASYLNWRLIHKPHVRYENLALLAGDRLLSLVSYRMSEKHEGRVGYVMDVLHRPQDWWSGRTLLRYAVADMAGQGMDVLLGWCLPHAPNYKTYASCAFIPFPRRLRPIELHFGVRPLAGDDARVTERRAWYLSYLDSDTV